MSVMTTYRAAIRALIPSDPDEALHLAEDYIGNHIDRYDGPALYELGQLVERARHQSGWVPRPTLEDIRIYVGDTNFMRGDEYLFKIRDMDYHDGVLSAIVSGTNEYNAWAAIEGGRIVDSECSCPVRSKTCKHVAAILHKSYPFEMVHTQQETLEIIASRI